MLGNLLPDKGTLLATVGSALAKLVNLRAACGQFCWRSWSVVVANVGRWLAFRSSARNCRLTLSSGQGAVLSLIVVRTTLPRTTPRKPSRCIKRSTVQRATRNRSRFICFHTLSAP
jgi:hypothetical protein